MGLIPLKVSMMPTTNLFALACIPLTSGMPSRGTLTGLRANMNLMKCSKVQGIAAGLLQSPITYQYRLGGELRESSPVKKERFQWIKTPGCNLHPRKPTVHSATPKESWRAVEGGDFPLSSSLPCRDPTWRTASSSEGLSTGKRGRQWRQVERAGAV